MSIEKKAGKLIRLTGRSNERRNKKRTWYETPDFYIVHIEHKCKDTGEWLEESFRAFTKNGSPGYKYQKTRDVVENAIDDFLKDSGIDITVIGKCEEGTPTASKVYQWTTFVVEEARVVSCNGGDCYVKSSLYMPVADRIIDFEGPRARTETIALRRYYAAFNAAYPGCTLEEDDDLGVW
jgi:hypothetical protein